MRQISATAGKFFLYCLMAMIMIVSIAFGSIFATKAQAIDEEPAGVNKFFSDYNSREETIEESEKLNIRIAEEGFTLLKNEDEALPLRAGSRISVFGKNSVNPVYGGSGSTGAVEDPITLYDGLRHAGFEVNPALEAFYNNNTRSGAGRDASPAMGSVIPGLSTGETPVSMYDKAVKDTFSLYDDAALVVLSRIGGEGSDLPRSMKTGFGADAEKLPEAKSADSHYLELTQYESDMLDMVCENYDKVIVIVNASQAMELGFLEDPEDEDYHAQIKAALWVGGPGETGFEALGSILNGTVSPSGRTVDTYARDFTKDPTYYNFSNNGTENGARLTQDNELTSYYEVEYEEGIYVGYRYYETRGYTDGEDWYKEAVVYPFGYGLSYTTFDWEVVSSAPAENSALAQDGTIEVTVRVTNTGDVPGKDVVQLYYTAPYTAGGIEKAHVVLGDFVKTDLLYPEETQEVTLTMDVRDMASYDYKNGKYVLDSGAYSIKVARNSHEMVDEIGYTISEKIEYTTDDNTGAQIGNLFADVTAHVVDEGDKKVLSRSDWTGTWPTTPTAAELGGYSDEFIASLTPAVDDDENDPWYTDEMPKQAEEPLTAEQATIKLSELVGVDKGEGKWEAFLDQLTVSQMVELVTSFFGTDGIPALGIPETLDTDGPANYNGPATGGTKTSWVTECVVAATWNKQLAYDMGRMFGNAALYGNSDRNMPYSGWYAPACNIHRTPFSGRNFEYYSEDGYLSGVMAAGAVAGIQSKGVFAFVKHFAVNDQESYRSDGGGIITWADEQAMREIYFKPFEMAVKDGGTMGIMSSMNRIGNEWTGSSYRLLTSLLRDEWGFEGAIVTDMSFDAVNFNSDVMIRAGGDLMLSPFLTPSNSEEANTPTHVAALRNAAQNILYVVANSNAMMNGVGTYEAKDLSTAIQGNSTNISVAAGADFGAAWVTYELADGSALPAGLSLDAMTGAITGTPTAAGTFTFTVNAIADGWVVRSAEFSLTVDTLAFSGETEYTATVGETVSIDVASSPVTEGTEVEYEVVDELPAGLTLNADGSVTGSVAAAGTYTFTIRAAAQGYQNADTVITLTVTESALSYQGQALAAGQAGAAYSGSVALASGVDGITYSLKEGSSLPAGLTLAANGAITGTPSEAGEYTFTVVASAGGEEAEATFTLSVAAGGGCGGSIALSSGLFLGCAALLAAAIALIVRRKKEN